jgi:PAS domain S-box-containing protein
MKKFQNLSVKVKVPLMMGVAGLGVFALVCMLLMRPLRSTSLEDSAKIAELAAANSGDRLAQRTRGTAKIVRSYAGVISTILDSKAIPDEKKREVLLTELAAIDESEKTMNGIWCVFEPNIIGADSLYVGKPGNTAKGVFAPRFVSGKLTASDELSDPNLYRIPKELGRETFSRPYEVEINGRKTKVFTYSMPIMHQGKFVGVIASFFDCRELQILIDGMGLNAVGKLLTPEGIVAVYRDYDRIGSVAEHGNRAILDKLPDGKIFQGVYEFEGTEVYKVYVPIRLAESEENPWYYAIDVPLSEIYGNARSTSFYLIVYCIIGVLLIAVAGWILIGKMLNKVSGITDIIRRLSLGRIDQKIEKTESLDELGKMRNELGELVDGLKRTAGFAHNIGEGNLNAEYNLLSDDDALGNSLLEMRQSLQRAETEQAVRAREEEQRNWVTAGLAKFAEILRRDNDDMEALSYNVISNMVKYVGINQGGIFILNDAEHVLEMKACYAFDRRKFAEKKIHPGEGLVGTCLLEGETIYMTEIPDAYISITSGLGDASPRALLISPLKVNEEIFGVVELASFKPFESYQLDFVQKVSESIAATISTVTVNIRTNKLLEQTKMQAEEMANQEEELRQNMEEMQATQEEMRRRETELQDTLNRMEEVQAAGVEKEHEMNQFHGAIFESNNVIEFSPDGFIVDVNDNFLRLFGDSRARLVGKHLSLFVGEEAFQAAKTMLEQNRIYEDVQTITAGGGDRRTIRQRFIPLTDKDGKLQKVLMLGFDETFVEEIRQHEEELRQNMEEMQATQEEMRRRETELDAVNYETEQLQSMILATSQVSTMSPEGVIVDVNDNLVRAFEGATRNDFVGKRLEEVVGKKESDAAMAHCRRGEPYEMVQGMPTGPDKTTVFRQKYVPICDKEGKLLRIMMVANDETYIDEMRQKEEELRQSMEEMQATQEEMRRREEDMLKLQERMANEQFEMNQYVQAIFKTCNVVVSSPEGIVIDINDRLLNMFGGAPKEAFVGKPMSTFTGEESFKTIWADMRKGKIHENTQQVDTGVGGVITYRQRFVPICDKSGKLLRVFELTDPE